VKVDGEAAEAIAEVLRPYAYQQGVALEQLGDNSSPDPDALEPQITVKIFVPEAEDTPAFRRRIEEILYHLNRMYPIPDPTFRVLAEEDWATAWKRHYHPFRVGHRIWVVPSWEEDAVSARTESGELQPDAIVLLLDPGMAFGTGLHPTTQHCLQALEGVVQPAVRVLDLGTGSGILGIAAAKLGAGEVLAVDTDAVAVEAAATNARLNDIAGRVTVNLGSLQDVKAKGWDVVVVNILAPVIVALLREAGLMGYVRQGGSLILSGIIEEQVSDVEAAVIANGGRVDQRLTERDWVSLIVRVNE
jgi:ribosomal protein L11 methyltransferase